MAAGFTATVTGFTVAGFTVAGFTVAGFTVAGFTVAGFRLQAAGLYMLHGHGHGYQRVVRLSGSRGGY